MTKNQIWVSPCEDGRKVHSAGAKKVHKIVETKAEALDIWTGVAKNKWSELIIQKKDGTIQNSNSFGNDPCPPLDTK